MLLSSVEPSTSARTKARVHASHGGPSRGIATPGRARSEREPTAFDAMSRARASSLLRASAAAAAAAFTSRRILCDASGAFSEPAASTPPDPAGLDAHRRGGVPHYRREQVHRAVARVHGRRAGPVLPRRPRGRGRLPRRALAEAKAGFGEDDPHVAAARNNLAELYRLQRRFDEAEKLYAVAAAGTWRSTTGPRPAAGAAVHNLAGCKLSRGDFAGAYAAYADAAAKKAEALGPNHPDYAATLFHMAEAKRAGATTEPPPRS